ncbi:MAG: hypothetical protein ACK5C3_12510, partial [bacterium]
MSRTPMNTRMRVAAWTTLSAAVLLSAPAFAQLAPPVPMTPPDTTPTPAAPPKPGPEGPQPEVVPGKNDPSDPVNPNKIDPSVMPNQRKPGEPSAPPRPDIAPSQQQGRRMPGDKKIEPPRAAGQW